jgi:hypothetical protein
MVGEVGMINPEASDNELIAQVGRRSVEAFKELYGRRVIEPSKPCDVREATRRFRAPATDFLIQ